MALLKQIREAAGKTQQDVCRELDISFSTVNRHERGKTRLGTVHRLAYAKYYGVKPESIEQPEWKPKRKRATATKPKASEPNGKRRAA